MTNEGSREACVLRWLLGAVAFLVLIWMLRAASTILTPLAIAAFIVMLVWPLQVWLERRLSTTLSVVVTIVVMMLVLMAVGTLLWICAGELASKAGEYRQLVESFIGRINTALKHYHLPGLQGHFNPARLIDQAMSLAGTFAVGTYQFGGFVVLVLVFVVLLLIEVQPFEHRLRRHMTEETAANWLDLTHSIAVNVHRFMLTRTFTSAITGVLTGLFTWAIGLDFPLVWGVIAFVLNYIPVLGSVVAVIPPTLVALLQPNCLWLAPTTLGGLTIIQMGVGNYLDPLLQGRYLSLPPLLVFFSLVFWGWVWGIPGALLGVPLTVAIVITCQHFENTRWLAQLLLKNSSEE